MRAWIGQTMYNIRINVIYMHSITRHQRHTLTESFMMWWQNVCERRILHAERLKFMRKRRTFWTHLRVLHTWCAFKSRKDTKNDAISHSNDYLKLMEQTGRVLICRVVHAWARISREKTRLRHIKRVITKRLMADSVRSAFKKWRGTSVFAGISRERCDILTCKRNHKVFLRYFHAYAVYVWSKKVHARMLLRCKRVYIHALLRSSFGSWTHARAYRGKKLKFAGKLAHLARSWRQKDAITYWKCAVRARKGLAISVHAWMVPPLASTRLLPPEEAYIQRLKDAHKGPFMQSVFARDGGNFTIGCRRSEVLSKWKKHSETWNAFHNAVQTADVDLDVLKRSAFATWAVHTSGIKNNAVIVAEGLFIRAMTHMHYLVVKLDSPSVWNCFFAWARYVGERLVSMRRLKKFGGKRNAGLLRRFYKV